MSIEKKSKITGDIRRIDLHTPGGRDELESLRQTLVSQGDLVSPAGRQRTIDVFGEPLSPRQVVEKICEDVKREGLCGPTPLAPATLESLQRNPMTRRP